MHKVSEGGGEVGRWKVKHTVQDKFLIEILPYLQCNGGSDVKNLPTVHKTQVSSVGQEDPLQKEMATCSSILVQEISWTEEAGYSSWGCKESGTTEQLAMIE